MKILMSMFLVFALLFSEVACTGNQINVAMDLIETQSPIALNMASNLSFIAGNEQLSKIFATAAADVKLNMPLVRSSVAAWRASKTDGNVTAVASVLTNLASKVNADYLEANKIAVGQDEMLAVASLGALALTLNGMVAALKTAGVKVALSTPSHEILPYVSQQQVTQVANEYKVSYDQAITALSGM